MRTPYYKGGIHSSESKRVSISAGLCKHSPFAGYVAIPLSMISDEGQGVICSMRNEAESKRCYNKWIMLTIWTLVCFVGPLKHVFANDAASGGKVLEDIWNYRAQIKSGRFEFTQRNSYSGVDGKEPPVIRENNFTMVVEGDRKKVVREGDGFLGNDLAAMMREAKSSKADQVSSGILRQRKEYYAYIDEPVFGPSLYDKAMKTLYVNPNNKEKDRMKSRVEVFDPRFVGTPETFEATNVAKKGIIVSDPIVDIRDNRTFYKVTASRKEDDWKMQIWIDPEIQQHTRIVATLGDREIIRELEYKKDPNSELWFPARTVVRELKNGKLLKEDETVVKNAELNVVIDPSEFSFRSLGMDRGTVFFDILNKGADFSWNGAELVALGAAGPSTSPDDDLVNSMLKQSANVHKALPASRLMETLLHPTRPVAASESTPVRSWWRTDILTVAVVCIIFITVTMLFTRRAKT